MFTSLQRKPSFASSNTSGRFKRVNRPICLITSTLQRFVQRFFTVNVSFSLLQSQRRSETRESNNGGSV